MQVYNHIPAHRKEMLEYQRQKAEMRKVWMAKCAESALEKAKTSALRIYEKNESSFAALRDKLLATFENAKKDQMKARGADKMFVQAMYEQKVCVVRVAYERNCANAYANYRARVDKAVQRYEEFMASIAKL